MRAARADAIFPGVVRRCAVLACVLAFGCGAAEAPARPAARRPAERAIEPAEAGPPPCRIEAARAEALTVAAAGVSPFGVSVSDGSLSFVPSEDERRLTVLVEHPLRFSATGHPEDQRLVLARGASFAAGAVHAVEGAPVIRIARTPRGLEGVIQIGRAPPGSGLELAVGPVPLECGDVIAEPAPEPRAVPSLPRQVPSGELHVAAASPLVLRPLRLAPARVEVRARGRDAFVPVWVIDRQSDDARVAIAFSDGARVEGWVPRTTLREPSAAEAELVARWIAGEPPGPVALGTIGALETTPPGPQADEYVGPASLRPGSPIAAEAGGAPWARNAEVPLEVRVRWARGSAHALLLEIPGLWVQPERAWVERVDVSLPE